VDGTILEAEDEPTGHAIAVCELDHVAVGQRLPVQCPEDEEAADQALRMTDGNRLGR
jgi:hypothetical protein